MNSGIYYPATGSLWTDKATINNTPTPQNEKLSAFELNEIRDFAYDLRSGTFAVSSSIDALSTALNTTGTFQVILFGVNPHITGTMFYHKLGNLVIAQLTGALFGTSINSAARIEGFIPSLWPPNTSQMIYMNASNGSGGPVHGIMVLDTSGTGTLYPNAGTGGTWNAGTLVVEPQSFTWGIN